MNFWKTIVGLIVLWIIYLKIKKLISHNNALGQRVIINYYDQNFHFETIFPLNGIISNKIKISNRRLFVVTLDKEFQYENQMFKEVIVQERAYGNYIGSNKEIAVHVMLPISELNKKAYDFEEFNHVVWATLTPLTKN